MDSLWGVFLINSEPKFKKLDTTISSPILYPWTGVSDQMHTLVDLTAELGFFEQLILLEAKQFIG